ncbi:hypothetical protein [Hydrococcus rivularis]|uniref:hypothetical protein n=1 Tax=Hydrococcus rivularis TaxID=1616834 RepID=UPI000AA82065|nr:hypothetical protein [Hydrococcus rivularis]
MNSTNKRFLLTVIAIAFVIVLSHQITTRAMAQDLSLRSIPSSIDPCLPKSQKNKSPLLRGAVEYRGKQYYVVELLYKTTPPFVDYEGDYYQGGRFFIQLDELGCLSLNTTDDATDLLFASMTQVVPEPVAQQLALQWWRKRLEELGSPEKLKQDILDGLKPGAYTLYLFAEDVWALKQLGITIPESALNQPR